MGRCHVDTLTGRPTKKLTHGPTQCQQVTCHAVAPFTNIGRQTNNDVSGRRDLQTHKHNMHATNHNNMAFITTRHRHIWVVVGRCYVRWLCSGTQGKRCVEMCGAEHATWTIAMAVWWAGPALLDSPIRDSPPKQRMPTHPPVHTIPQHLFGDQSTDLFNHTWVSHLANPL